MVLTPSPNTPVLPIAFMIFLHSQQVPRGDRILDWAVQVIKAHAERKAILEVEFLGEEGTGLGPTLEFFALVAAELQRKVNK